MRSSDHATLDLARKHISTYGDAHTVRWQPFQYSGITYDLANLNSRIMRYTRPAGRNHPAETFDVQISFSLHCFSRAPKPGEAYQPAQVYPDSYELRLFDPRRHEASLQLPDMIQTLPNRKPRHNKGGRNYFTIELLLLNGEPVEYDIFFKVKKPAKGRMEMIVESAFIRDPDYGTTRPDGKPIRFWIILHNTRHGLRITS